MSKRLRFLVNRESISAGLPPHGFLVHMDDRDNVVGSRGPFPLFSIAFASRVLDDFVGRGLLKDDELAGVQKDLAASGLSENLTRFDRIVIASGFDDTSRYIIERFAGKLEPDQAPSPARFEICRNGTFCGFTNCTRYGAHGVFFFENIDVPSSCEFSTESAMSSLNTAAQNGYHTQDDRMHLGQQVEVAVLAPKTGRADRIMRSELKSKEAFLDIAFGIHVPEKPARLEACDDVEDRHFHLLTFDDVMYAPDRIGSREDAGMYLACAVDDGAISEEDRTRIVTGYDAIGMPAFNTKPSLMVALERLKETIERTQRD